MLRLVNFANFGLVKFATVVKFASDHQGPSDCAAVHSVRAAMDTGEGSESETLPET